MLIGVESVTQLRENLEAFKKPIPDELFGTIEKTFAAVPLTVCDPRKW